MLCYWCRPLLIMPKAFLYYIIILDMPMKWIDYTFSKPCTIMLAKSTVLSVADLGFLKGGVRVQANYCDSTRCYFTHHTTNVGLAVARAAWSVLLLLYYMHGYVHWYQSYPWHERKVVRSGTDSFLFFTHGLSNLVHHDRMGCQQFLPPCILSKRICRQQIISCKQQAQPS